MTDKEQLKKLGYTVESNSKGYTTRKDGVFIYGAGTNADTGYEERRRNYQHIRQDCIDFANAGWRQAERHHKEAII